MFAGDGKAASADASREYTSPSIFAGCKAASADASREYTWDTTPSIFAGDGTAASADASRSTTSPSIFGGAVLGDFGGGLCCSIAAAVLV